MLLRPPTSPLFPYTTLFRSPEVVQRKADAAAFQGTHLADHIIEIVHQQAFGQLQFDTGSVGTGLLDRKSTRLNSSHVRISYAVFCLKKKSKKPKEHRVC